MRMIRTEHVEDYVRRRFYELQQQRGYQPGGNIKRADCQEILLKIAQELLFDRDEDRNTARSHRYRRWLKATWNCITLLFP